MLLSEAALFVLDVSKKEPSKNVWKGECAHRPIYLKNVISIQAIAKRSEVFVEDDINKTVRHFEIIYHEPAAEDKNGSRAKKHRVSRAA